MQNRYFKIKKGRVKAVILTLLVCFCVMLPFLDFAKVAANNSDITNLDFTTFYRQFPPNATISGSATVCLDDVPEPEITFTGSAGVAPYTFTYTINGGTDQTISTAGTDDSISIPINTNTTGSFVYELVSVSDNNGNSEPASGSATITIVNPPSVSFTFNNNQCSGLPVSFTPSITGSGPFIFNWNFGDGASSTLQNTSHIYDAEGCGTRVFSASLTVTDSNNCSTTVSELITIEERPDISFEDLDAGFGIPFDNCGNNATDPNYTINVGNISTSASCISSYNVDWGDGSSATGITFPATHTYTQLGSFNAVITGLGNNGCVSNETIIIRNSSNPTGAIETPGNTVNLCIPNTNLQFTIGSWGTNPPDTVYTIDYGDGTEVIINQADMESSVFYDAADPAASQNFPIPHTYTESNCPEANYTLALNIMTSCGESNLTAGPIIILSQPTPNFEFDSPGCVNTPVQFTNTTEGGFGPNCSDNSAHSWDFGDGNTSTDESPSHTYTTPGTYTVTLTEENFCGVSPPISQTICIEAEPTAAFTLDNIEGCTPFDVNATNTTNVSQFCGAETYLWELTYTPEFCGTVESWIFTNGTDENSVNPSFQFNSAGQYNIQLTVTNSCGDNITNQIVQVKQPPNAVLDQIDDACGPISVNPIATVDDCAPASEVVTYGWLFPGGTPATSNQLNPGAINYSAVGDYTITFSVTNSCGTTTVTEDFSISDIPTITNTDLTQTICSGTDSNEIVLTSNTPNTTYTWVSNNPAGLSGFIASGSTDTIPAQTLINSTSSDVILVYTVTPEVNGCIGTPVDFEITVQPAPTITNQPLSDQVCLNGVVNDLSVTIQGSGTPTYQWFENIVDDNTTGTAIPGETSATFSPPTNTLGSIYYYVVITFTTGGCGNLVSNTAEIDITDSAQIDTEPQNNQSICLGGTADELEIQVSGGSGTATYQWFTNTTNSNTGGTIITGANLPTYAPPVFNTIGTFYYYVEVTYSASGCAALLSSVSEIIVIDDPIITIQPLNSQSLCLNTTPQNLEVQVSGGLGNISYQWYVNTVNSNFGGTIIAGENQPLFTPPTNTVGTFYYYAVITQDVSGCEVISDVSELEVNSGAQFDLQPISNEICLGDSTPALEVSFINGAGTPTYQWYENTTDDTISGTAIFGANMPTYNPDVSNVGTTYYYAILTFTTGGCPEIISNTAEIILNQTPQISDTALLICSDTAFQFVPDIINGDIVPANTQYTWTSPTISPAGVITGTSAQTSPVTNVSQVLINTSSNPAIVTYTVTPISGICQGASFEIEVTVNPSISILDQVANSLCFGSNSGAIDITISGGVPFTTGNAYNITWSGPNGFTSTDEDISNLEPGQYTVDIQDDGGCPFTESFTITDPDELVFTSIDFDPDTISCFNANDGQIGIAIGGGTLPYAFSWTLNGAPFSSDEDLSNLGPGDYTITITDGNGCGPITQDFNIIEPQELDVVLDVQTNVLCFGELTGAISVLISGGRPNYSYSWVGPNGYTSTDQNISDLESGIYDLTVTDASNCIDTLEVEIIQNSQIEIDVTVMQVECFGDNDGSIVINNITGGVAPHDIAWSNLGTGMQQTDLSPGTYTITITDADNCQRDFPIVIDDVPVFDVNPVVTQMSCSGANDASINLNFIGGVDPVNLVWNDGSPDGTERNNLGPGTYSVTITDATTCVIEESFTIFDIPPLLLSATITNALECDNANSGAINLIVQGGSAPYTFLWSNGEVTEDLDDIGPDTYSVTVIDANGCDVEGNWTVDRFDPLQLEVITNSDPDCDTGIVNQSFEAMATGGVPPFTYSWSSGTVTGPNNEFMTTDLTGLVVLQVEDDLGCIFETTFDVEAIEFGGDVDFSVSSFAFLNFGIFSIEDLIEFTNEATGDFESILWDFGDGSFSTEENPIHTYSAIGNYVVTQTVTYPFGCVYTSVVTLIVEKGYELLVPDAFTPNEDSLNDFFRPEQRGLNNLELRIYDTWGSIVYTETGESLQGWDGKVKNEIAENGNYYYTFSGTTFYGKEIKKQGALVFIK
ncbi:MAG: PKD domain-containing protein [Winogradskyella sp.]|nr:MAG: PKD domain-containing protein [Winogradskyella sp.]